VNYVVNQECPTLAIGSAGINHPAKPNEDISKLHEKGVPVYAVQEDLEERGIGRGNCLTCVQVIPRTEIANLLEEHDQIWALVINASQLRIKVEEVPMLVSISDSNHATGRRTKR